VTKSAGQTKDVVIYDRSISKIFENAIMGEYNALQIINSFSLLLNLRVHLLCLYMFAYLSSSLPKQVNCHIPLGSYLW